MKILVKLLIFQLLSSCVLAQKCSIAGTLAAYNSDAKATIRLEENGILASTTYVTQNGQFQIPLTKNGTYIARIHSATNMYPTMRILVESIEICAVKACLADKDNACEPVSDTSNITIKSASQLHVTQQDGMLSLKQYTQKPVVLLAMGMLVFLMFVPRIIDYLDQPDNSAVPTVATVAIKQD